MNKGARSPSRKSTYILRAARADAGIPTDKQLFKQAGIEYRNGVYHMGKPETWSVRQLAVIADLTDMDDKTLGDFIRAVRKEVL